MILIGGVQKEHITAYTPAKRRLAGTTQVNGVGTHKRVAVFHRDTLVYLGSTVSGIDGVWALQGLQAVSEEKILCINIDDTRSVNPIAFDNVSLVE